MPFACVGDDTFGPVIQGCRDDFDFTIKFENIFFSITPASIFILFALVRLVYIAKLPRRVNGRALQIVKLVTAFTNAGLSLVLLILIIVEPTIYLAMFKAATAVNLVAATSTVILSYFEHSRSPRPSVVLGVYLLISFFLDITRLRTLWLAGPAPENAAFVRVFTASVLLKGIILLLESQSKAKYLLWDMKDHSPEETSGIYSLSFFFWLNELFLRGFRKILRVEDLYALDRALLSQQLSTAFDDQLLNYPLERKRFALARVLLKLLAVDLAIPILPRLCLTGASFCQPFLIRALLNYLQRDPTTASNNHGYGLIGAAALTYGGIAISTALYWYYQERAMFKTRGFLAAAVYKKSTQAKVFGNSAPLTLMTTDIERVRLGFVSMHEIWANLIEVAIACWLLERELGAAFSAPVVLVLISAATSSVLGRFLSRCQRAWMEAIQQRVSLTANVIAQMKNLKISALATPTEALIQNLRVTEIFIGNRWRRLMALAVTISYLPLVLSPVFTFVVNTRLPSTTTIFLSISYLNLLSTPLAALLQKIPQFLAAFTCLERLQEFLTQETHVDQRKFIRPVAPLSRDVSTISESENFELVRLKPSGVELTKSAIAIVNGYFGWEPERSVLRNINIEIGSARITMVVGPVASGKSSLCMALLGELQPTHGEVLVTAHIDIGYCDQSPFLQNTSILHNIVGFNQFDAQRYDSVIRATMLHTDFCVLPQGDETLVGSNGITLSGGQRQRVAIARALYHDSKFLIFDDALSGLDAGTEDHVFDHILGHSGIIRSRGIGIVLVTNSVRHLRHADHIITLDENGTVIKQGSYDELVSNPTYVALPHTREAADQPESKPSRPALQNAAMSPRTHEPTVRSQSNDASKLARQVGHKGVHRYYFGTIGIAPATGFLITGVCWGVFYNFPQIWLEFWGNDLARPVQSQSSSYYIGIYAALQVSALVSITAAVLMTLVVLIRLSGIELHRRALQTVINAPLRFFATTDVGVITNLFSQDMTLIDGELPIALNNFCLTVFQVVGMAVVIATSSPWLIITYPGIALVMWAIQMFYLRTSRQLRLLDLEAKSPLSTHFIDTIKGVVTIRSFNWVPQNLAKNNTLLDNSQRPAYLLSMIQRWLLFAMNLVVMFLATAVVALSTQLRGNPGFAGVTLVTLMNLALSLSNIVKFYAVMETAIGAVSRLKDFTTNTKNENFMDLSTEPTMFWPESGHVKLQGLSITYNNIPSFDTENISISNMSRDLALQNLDISINAGEKVAICGRTGRQVSMLIDKPWLNSEITKSSGKSSLLLLLLRLIDPLPTGHILSIDGVALDQVDRVLLRQRIIAVPQDAVFLPDGTSFLQNLDPFQAASAEECQSVLQVVGLWEFVETRGGLNAGMVADTMSQGQKQLFSLARAVLRKRIKSKLLAGSGPTASDAGQDGGLLLLDEFSSSVDSETDRTMHTVIMQEFTKYTIIMVSHRLEMVMKFFGRVIVIDQGRVVESGDPHILNKSGTGYFANLVRIGGL